MKFLRSKIHVAIMATLFAGALAVGLFATTGCKTVTDSGGGTHVEPVISTNTIELIGQGLELTTAAGVKLAIAQDPNTRSYFILAASVVDALVQSGQLDAAQLDDALSKISVNEIRDNTIVRAAIISALGAYSVLEGQVVSQQLDKTFYLTPLLRHLAAGLREGCAMTASRRVGAGRGYQVWPHPISH